VTNRFAVFAVVAGVAVLVPRPSRAGYQAEFPVTVSSTEAYGSMGSAYHSSDAYQYIGCQVSATSSSSLTVSCYATDASQNQVLCSVASGAAATQFAQNLANASSDSWILFNISGSTCTQVIVSSASSTKPK
jgi:hypothetical protein